MTTVTESRTAYIDILKIFATIMVVFLHISALYISTGNIPNSVSNFFLYHTNYTTRIALQIFMMCTGMLLLRPQYTFHFRKKIFFIIRLYVIWSAIYLFIRFVAYTIMHHTVPLDEAILYFITGPYHFWYLVILFGFYLLMPILRHCKDFSTLTYLLMALLFLVLVYPQLLPLLHERVLVIANDMFLIVPKQALLFFILGAWLERLPQHRMLLVASLFIGAFGFYWRYLLFMADKSYGELLIESPAATAATLCATGGIFYSVKFLCRDYTSSPLVRLLSKHTLYIYIMSPLVIFFYEFILKKPFDAWLHQPTLASFLWTPIVFIVTAITAHLLHLFKKILHQKLSHETADKERSTL